MGCVYKCTHTLAVGATCAYGKDESEGHNNGTARADEDGTGNDRNNDRMRGRTEAMHTGNHAKYYECSHQ